MQSARRVGHKIAQRLHKKSSYKKLQNSVNASNDKLGWIAPNFKLLNIDDKKYSLTQLRGTFGTVVVFICCHCPYVISIAARLSKEAKELKKHSINTITIMSNDVIQYPDDSFVNMKKFSQKYNFTFPFLYDESQ